MAEIDGHLVQQTFTIYNPSLYTSIMKKTFLSYGGKNGLLTYRDPGLLSSHLSHQMLWKHRSLVVSLVSARRNAILHADGRI